MFLSDDIKKIKSSPRDLRNFGLAVGGICLILGFWFLYRGRSTSFIFILIGAALVLLGLVSPRILQPVYKVWMTLAVAMGFLMTNIILTVFFYFVMTPFAFILRLSGKRFLDLGFRTGQKSYWNYRPHREASREDLEKQF